MPKDTGRNFLHIQVMLCLLLGLGCVCAGPATTPPKEVPPIATSETVPSAEASPIVMAEKVPSSDVEKQRILNEALAPYGEIGKPSPMELDFWSSIQDIRVKDNRIEITMNWIWKEENKERAQDVAGAISSVAFWTKGLGSITVIQVFSRDHLSLGYWPRVKGPDYPE